MKPLIHVLIAMLLLSVVCLSEEADAHFGMALLKFEIHQNGQRVHDFRAAIRDDASLPERWDLLLDEDLPVKLAMADKSGGANLCGAVEIRMLHAGRLLCKSTLADIQLTPGKAGAWKVKQSELQRIKKAAQVVPPGGQAPVNPNTI